jgi:tRNA threonylcarbamoyladenosine biosynthesis protein TsaE
MESRWDLPALQNTERLGAWVARSCPLELPGPRLLFLTGELGSGKTTLTAALLATLGVTESVRSPTFALIELYSIQHGAGGSAARHNALAVHVDLYRLRSADELVQLGLRDYLNDETLLIVEWAERAGAQLPQPDLWLRLEVASEGRCCQARAHSAAGRVWLAALGAQSDAPTDG